jgi:hypothetical protein
MRVHVKKHLHSQNIVYNKAMKSEQAKRKSRGDDYVNNKVFSAAVVEYVQAVQAAKDAGREPQQITNYIGECFLKIANGLSRSPNFMNYSYREDMVMDAVENCIKAIMNYDINKPTRTGNPNAFSYFTQISWYAFLRRIAKEKKQADIKQLLIEKGGIGNFAEFDDDDLTGEFVVEKMRQRNDAFYKECDEESKATPRVQKKVALPKETIGALDDFIA